MQKENVLNFFANFAPVKEDIRLKTFIWEKVIRKNKYILKIIH